MASICDVALKPSLRRVRASWVATMPEFATPLTLLLLPVPLLVRWLLPRAPAQGAAMLVPDGVGDVILQRAQAQGRARWQATVLPILT